MEGSLQNRLLQLEITPPPAAWEKIAAALDEEFVASDSVIASKLENAGVAAPQGVWEHIDAALHNEPPVKRKVFSIVLRRIAVAAMLIGLTALGVFYFLNDRKNPTPQVAQTTKKENLPAPVSPNTEKDKGTIATTAPPVISDKPNRAAVANVYPKRIKKAGLQASFRSNNRNVTNAVYDYDARGEVKQAPLYELNTVSALQPVSVSAPPIRDKKGNLILDLATISNPDDPYITVTGPNGKQTKISSKFLSCLSYMNAGSSPSEMDARALRCKSQFEEWRNRLLSEPGFIPTANNFFDIFELKDLLEEM